MILYTWPKFLSNESQILNDLLCRGLKYLHIYKPYAQTYLIENLIEGINVCFRKRLIMHFYYSIAEKYQLGGIHLSKSLSFHGKTHFYWVSRSVHCLCELNTIEKQFTHIIISPLFDSISKVNHNSSWNYDDLKFFLQSNNKPFQYIALGGINIQNYYHVRKMGFDDAAFLGDFWRKYFQQGDTSIIDEYLHITQTA